VRVRFDRALKGCGAGLNLRLPPRGRDTDRQFMAFVDKEVTPDFPDGLTLRTGRGQCLISWGVWRPKTNAASL
jgi:hypothetical protein